TMTRWRPAFLGESFGRFASDIKLAHSIFALPFAASAFIVGSLAQPNWFQVLLLLLCMVAARSFAMGVNRLLDSDIDRLNPRTQGRMIPSGRMSKLESSVWCGLSAAFLIGGAFALNQTAGFLSL